MSEMTIAPFTSSKSRKCTATLKFARSLFKFFETKTWGRKINVLFTNPDSKNSQVRTFGGFLEQKGGEIRNA